MKHEAGVRIVEIQGVLAEQFLGTEKRAELMTEQTALWDQHFAGRPYDEIYRDAWLTKGLRNYG